MHFLFALLVIIAFYVRLSTCEDGHMLTKIGFGSCLRQDQNLSIFDRITEEHFDAFILLGDNIYADARATYSLYPNFTIRMFTPATRETMLADYEALFSNPHFATFLEDLGSQNMHAVWDDHDFGINNGGKDYEGKHMSRDLFLRYWGVEPSSPRYTQPGGLYFSTSLSFEGLGSAKLVMPDLRFMKDDFSDPEGSFMDEEQWRWLERVLLEDTGEDVLLLGSSLQLLADDFCVGERWCQFPQDRERILDLILASPFYPSLLILSGDIHLGERSISVCKEEGKEESGEEKRLVEMTSSGFTHGWGKSHNKLADVFFTFVEQVYPAHNREDQKKDLLMKWNYGSMTIDWTDRELHAYVHDEEGIPRIAHTIPLRPKQGESCQLSRESQLSGKDRAVLENTRRGEVSLPRHYTCDPVRGRHWSLEESLLFWGSLSPLLLLVVSLGLLVVFLGLWYLLVGPVLYVFWLREGKRRDALDGRYEEAAAFERESKKNK